MSYLLLKSLLILLIKLSPLLMVMDLLNMNIMDSERQISSKWSFISWTILLMPWLSLSTIRKPMILEKQFAQNLKIKFQLNFLQSAFKPESGPKQSQRKKFRISRRTLQQSAMVVITAEKENYFKDTKRVRRSLEQSVKCKSTKIPSLMLWNSENWRF